MICNEVQSLHGPYLDSELDAKTSLEIEQHLKSCPECARLFVEEQKLAAQLKAHLNQGSRTPALWERIESSVAAAASSASRPGIPPHVPQPVGWPALLSALGAQLRAHWQTSRWAWTGLAAVWAVILAMNLATRQPDAPLVAAQEVPSASEMRFALKQKKLLMAEITITSEPVPASKPQATPPSPRSDRRITTQNT